MNRRRHQEPLHGIQLFPFVAVLLCTMGALLVILVSVARSSKSRAVEVAENAKAKAIAAAPVDEALSAKIRGLRQQSGVLQVQQQQAHLALRDEQSRLSHMEDHMRRLQDELEGLKSAAVELNTLADAHFADRAQAESELERLHQLVAERMQAIEQLRNDKVNRRTYAVLPSKTDSGTLRPPVYFECSNRMIVLQPEGIAFSLTDFRGPPGPGNPAAVAFRAAREELVRQQNSTAGDESEPYALIIVRPDGQMACDLLCKVFDKSGIDFGYEFVEYEANIKYPPPDPQMRSMQVQAVGTARGRLEMLAKAAPELYDMRKVLAPYNNVEDADFPDDMTPAANYQSQRGVASGSKFAVDSNARQAYDEGRVGVVTRHPSSGRGVPGGTSNVAMAATGTSSVHKGGPGVPASAGPESESGGPIPGVSQVAGSSYVSSRTAAVGSPQLASNNGGAGATDVRDRPVEFGNYDPRKSSPNCERVADDEESEPRRRPKIRGKEWAINGRVHGAVPIRRTIRVTVRDDAIVILPESGAKNVSAEIREIPFSSTTYSVREEIADALQSRIENWGMAGQGLYWRPVIEFEVEADGHQRVEAFEQILSNSGIEIKPTEVAQSVEGGSTRASR